MTCCNGDDCCVECPPGYIPFCSWNGETCYGYCMKSSESGNYPEIESLKETLEKIRLKEPDNPEIPIDPTVPIDPVNPMTINFPTLQLWQAAILLNAISRHQLMIPANRAMDEVNIDMGEDARPFIEIIEALGLQIV